MPAHTHLVRRLRAAPAPLPLASRASDRRLYHAEFDPLYRTAARSFGAAPCCCAKYAKECKTAILLYKNCMALPEADDFGAPGTAPPPRPPAPPQLPLPILRRAVSTATLPQHLWMQTAQRVQVVDLANVW